MMMQDAGEVTAEMENCTIMEGVAIMKEGLHQDLYQWPMVMLCATSEKGTDQEQAPVSVGLTSSDYESLQLLKTVHMENLSDDTIELERSTWSQE
ncbi:hypothetical protein AV530_002593 [Patagioenas fasciata monilis]|uniref:Uncharacterized protein n=1 Tax=Patagioenas fasciata monilis TaxID=372326 RepID=A0A1V4K8M1_PATFA|nr:hypothetical protein AV530_002593 [Patagioenas fasciata monilis]